MRGAIDRMREDAFLPGLGDEVSALLADNEAERAADTGPVDEQGCRVHTGGTLLKRRPAAYALIPKLAAEGMGVRSICKVLNVSPHSVAAVLAKESGNKTVSGWRAEFSGRMRGTAEMALARANELLADDRAVKEAGIKGFGGFLQTVVKALEAMKDGDGAVIDGDAQEADEAEAMMDYVMAARGIAQCSGDGGAQASPANNGGEQ